MTELKKISGIFILFMLFTLAVPAAAFAETKAVNNADELQLAVNQGHDVVINADFEINKTIDIPAAYKGTIKSEADKKTLTLAADTENMFNIRSGSEVSFLNLTLDGNKNGRLMNIGKSKVTIQSGILKNGSTESFKEAAVNGVNTQKYNGGAIYADHSILTLRDTTFESNKTKDVVPVPGTPHGGAIYSASADITVTGGKFLNNRTGKVSTQHGSHGEGGAIKLEPGSTLKINDENTSEKDATIFDGNRLDSWKDEGGRQGGSIEATLSKVYIYGTTFKIPGPFNTGGAIKFEGAPEAVIKNSAFSIDSNRAENFGIAGGAITSENSHLSIESSDFSAGQNTRVYEAGGLIQVVGTGTFNLIKSNLTGSGAWFNAGKYTAKYGGAISFYGNSALQTSVKAVIEDSTIKDFMVDCSGAGISIANGHGEKAKADVTIKNTKILNNSAYTWDGRGHGGGIFVGGGNTVLIEGGAISSPTASNHAGGIYNEGHITLTGGVTIDQNKGYQMVGGVYNNGYLKVDNATFSNNTKGDYSTGNGHSLDKNEMSGQSIYADKDVIVTPKAKFDNQDVRVINGQSAVVLTGSPANRINISISENRKSGGQGLEAEYAEDQIRHIGYVAAKGDGSYKPTEEDAKKLHYVRKDDTEPVSDYDDYTSIGKWDYVLNPETNQVVLGQRAKLIYHSNTGKFAGSNETTKEELITVYKEDQKGFTKDSAPVPQKEGYSFVDWYKEAARKSVQDMPNETSNAKDKFDFANAVVSGSGPITGILNPNLFNVYAGYIKKSPNPDKPNPSNPDKPNPDKPAPPAEKPKDKTSKDKRPKDKISKQNKTETKGQTPKTGDRGADAYILLLLLTSGTLIITKKIYTKK